MSAKKVVTVRLDAADYDRLSTEAKRLDVSRGTLARAYVRAGLAEDDAPADERRRAGLAALAGFAALRARLPDAGPVDVAQLIPEGRDALSRRTAP